jgi:GT2 family glycosyltransferase
MIVPNYMGIDIFPHCIDSLLKQDYPNLEIVFSDDCSTDGSYEHAKRVYGANKNVVIIRSKKNNGYTGAINNGYKHSSGAYIVLGNNDCVYPKNWISEMYRTVKGKKNVLGGSFGRSPRQDMNELRSTLRHHLGTFTLTGTMASRRRSPLETEFVEVHAAGLLIIPRTAIGDKIFIDSYFAYGEDVELCWRLRLRGYHIVVNPRAIYVSEGSYTRKKLSTFNKRASFHSMKNIITNFLVFYEWKNILRIGPWFMLMTIGRAFARPAHWPQYAKGYLWALTHLGTIIRRRREIQRTRTVGDDEIIRLLSYKLHEESTAASTWRTKVIIFANACMRVYCKIVMLKTFDRDDADAYPSVDPSFVQRRDT